MRSRLIAAVALAAVLLAGVAVLALGRDRSGRGGAPSSPATRRALASGSPAAFAFLSRQRTNRCDLQASEIASYPRARRMRGSCCSPMDQATYRRQVRYLRRYRALGEVPRDPYDVPAGLAQRLLRYEREIHLTRPQRVTYRHAMQMSREKGPCCCRCWRWEALAGMAKHLVARRRWPPARLAALIEALDGCGGASKPGSHRS